MPTVETARVLALDAIDKHLELDPEASAWDMPASIAKKRGWNWAQKTITGREYAALVLMLHLLVKEEQ